MFNRIFLFLLTNVAVLMLAGVVMSVLGVNPAQMSGLLVMAAIFGFGGSFIFLAAIKFMAKAQHWRAGHHRAAHAHRALVAGDRAPSGQAAGIGMPEVAVYDGPEINAFATGANRNNALVAVSTGLLQHMDQDEAGRCSATKSPTLLMATWSPWRCCRACSIPS